MYSKKMKVLSIVIGTTILMAGCGNKEKEVIQAPLKPVVTEMVRIEEYNDDITISGNVKPSQMVKNSFKIPGTVKEVYIKEGQEVSVGQPLMELTQGEIDIMVSGAQAQYDSAKMELDSKIGSAISQAEANVNFLTTQLDRVRRLHEKGAVSNKTLEELELGLVVAETKLQEAREAKETAVAQLKQAEANLNLAHSKMNDTMLYSTIDGTVIKQVFEEGETVGPGIPAVVVGRLDKLDVEFGATDELITNIKMGDRLKVKIYGANIEADGVVTGIDAAADVETRTFGVRVEIDNTEGIIKPGMIGNVIIPKGQIRGIMVPIDTIIDDSETKSVFVYGEDGKVIKREVKVGEVLGNKVQIKEGLGEGERLVIEGQYGLLDGEEVNARGVEDND